MAPIDKILGINDQCKADTFPLKVNLCVGAYRDEKGNSVVLKSVREAEHRVIGKKLDKEYTAITGLPSFVEKAIELAYGRDGDILSTDCIAATQSISGTGGCRLMAEFVATFSLAKNRKIHIPSLTWPNHITLSNNAGLIPVTYKYYNIQECRIDFTGMVEDIRAAEDGSLFMLHACAHNPTGCDPTREQWDELSAIMKAKRHMIFFDLAYQGFASGDPERDAYSVRKFVQDGHQIMLSQSFAKNFGLYGERTGLFSIVTASAEEAERVNSQLKVMVRGMYSNPPIHGARIVVEILSDPALKSLWLSECKGMADRIQSMRLSLRQKVEAGMLAATPIDGSKSRKNWSHITEQIGMFCYTGLSLEQVLRLRSEFHVYCTDDGRFSMAGVNESNIDYLSHAMVSVCMT
eukprot:CAMPEP_0170067586 /NCGR_PEP_ID=MMETSP0019_2-20121128/6872_1 /TAXON_ID=98059 /ORGANISM="Dinobryon sp., Strain UTEXLB2267" /LENGTH=405 /DNA_ID=CAMNT_0010275001 /DNA_START=46 /DNA_END=1263 /DNA_ORIENTATION=-